MIRTCFQNITRILTCCFIFAMLHAPVFGDALRLLPAPVLKQFSDESSGEAAKRNLEFISRQHRMRGSEGFRAAAEYIVEQLHRYGISDAKIEKFPADGKIFYGTQRSRPPWDAEFAELWEVTKKGERLSLIASWESVPLTLAQDSENGDVRAALVDVGIGTKDEDYRGKNVAGKLVLVSSQPEAAAPFAVEKYGAAGLISYAQNQQQAWWGEDENLIRWGHLDTFAAKKTFAFMVSPKQARSFQNRLNEGEEIWLDAKVKAGKHAGAYEVVIASIAGNDPRWKEQEIAFSCHLDHPRPGANDNASGCSAILEVARSYAKLIREKRIPTPARTIRFIWPEEVEGTLALLNAQPELAKRIRSVIHMDMVGGGPETKAIFHITRGPASLPSFEFDVADEFGRFVNQQTDLYASTGVAEFPLSAPEGGKEALLAQLAQFSMGSDHDVYMDSSFAIPAVYMNDWPDRYIHTNHDSPSNIDPTKLKRAAFLGAAIGYFLATFDSSKTSAISDVLAAAMLRRAASLMDRRSQISDAAEWPNMIRYHEWYERKVVQSIGRYFPSTKEMTDRTETILTQLRSVLGDPSGNLPTENAYQRNANLKGPMSVFGYDYFESHYGSEKAAKLKIMQYGGLWADAEIYKYEALNLVDGKRSVREIRDILSAAYGPIPLETVEEYLQALESVAVIKR